MTTRAQRREGKRMKLYRSKDFITEIKLYESELDSDRVRYSFGNQQNKNWKRNDKGIKMTQ